MSFSILKLDFLFASSFYDTVVHKELLGMWLRFSLLLGVASLFLQKTYLQFHWKY